MLSSGLLSEGPAEFGRLHNRRWLVSDYEAGDVVLHSPYTVRILSPQAEMVITDRF
jgi:phytanoyl-CoA hydroxylase